MSVTDREVRLSIEATIRQVGTELALTNWTHQDSRETLRDELFRSVAADQGKPLPEWTWLHGPVAS